MRNATLWWVAESPNEWENERSQQTSVSELLASRLAGRVYPKSVRGLSSPPRGRLYKPRGKSWSLVERETTLRRPGRRNSVSIRRIPDSRPSDGVQRPRGVSNIARRHSLSTMTPPPLSRGGPDCSWKSLGPTVAAIDLGSSTKVIPSARYLRDIYWPPSPGP